VSCLETLIHETSKVYEKQNGSNSSQIQSNSAEFEDTISRLVTKFEFKAKGVDFLCPMDILDPADCAGQLRNVDPDELLKCKENLVSYHDLIYGIIDKLESAYFTRFFNRTIFQDIFLLGPRLSGFFVAALSMYMLICVSKELFS
jgi:hypothetical protein